MADRSPARLRWVCVLLVGLALAACTATPSLSSSGTPSGRAIGSASAAASSTPTALPTATPEPPLSLELPLNADVRRIRFTVKVQPDLTATTSGHLVVTVSNVSDTTVAELVLRWPTALGKIIFLAPFQPSAVRIREGGPPLFQEWTKWVEGPGEQGEPAGTTSLGWGPLLPGATITISLVANRVALQPCAFDLQILAGEAILTNEAGTPAELRVALP